MITALAGEHSPQGQATSRELPLRTDDKNNIIIMIIIEVLNFQLLRMYTCIYNLIPPYPYRVIPVPQVLLALQDRMEQLEEKVHREEWWVDCLRVWVHGKMSYPVSL